MQFLIFFIGVFLLIFNIYFCLKWVLVKVMKGYNKKKFCMFDYLFTLLNMQDYL